MNENQNQVGNNGMNTIQIGDTVVSGPANVVSTPAQGVQTQQPVNVTPTPMPAAQPAPVTPTPMPAAQPANVAPTPMQTVQPTTATPATQPQSAESPFFTPVSVQPQVSVQPELPEIVPATPEPAKETVVQTTEQPESNVEVISTAPRKKGSSVVLIIFLILLILFVVNIDTVIQIYDEYKSTGTITNPFTKNTDNITNGFILIDENTSSIKMNDIKFYNFRKSQGKGITFNYESLANYNDVKTLEIYLELYDSEKELLYKELFDPNQVLEKDTVRIYVIDVDDEIFNDSFYALVKTYTDAEKQETASLTCTKEEGDYTYKNTYSFVNKGLTKYDVELTSKKENDKLLTDEYNKLKEENNATLENNTLKYTIDLNLDNGELKELYEKGATIRIVKNKETLKEWKCE